MISHDVIAMKLYIIYFSVRILTSFRVEINVTPIIDYTGYIYTSW